MRERERREKERREGEILSLPVATYVDKRGCTGKPVNALSEPEYVWRRKKRSKEWNEKRKQKLKQTSALQFNMLELKGHADVKKRWLIKNPVKRRPNPH